MRVSTAEPIPQFHLHQISHERQREEKLCLSPAGSVVATLVICPACFPFALGHRSLVNVPVASVHTTIFCLSWSESGLCLS